MPSVQQLQAYADHINASTPLRYFHLKVSFPDAERVRVSLDDVQPQHRGGLGTLAINGGTLAAIFDLALGCTPALVDPTLRNATIQLSMSFERPVTGNSVVAEAVIDSAGMTTLFASARIFDSKGIVCARCQGLVRLSKKGWESGVSPAVT